MNTPLTTIVIAALLTSVCSAQSPRPVIRQFTKFKNPLIRDSPHTVLVVNGKAYIQGDIYLGPITELEAYETSLQIQAVINDSGRWPNGIVPFLIVGGFNADEEQTIVNALNHYISNTHVCFVPKTTQSDYIKFRKVSVEELGYNGGHSALGKQGGAQEIQFSGGGRGVLRHEMGHALGLLHEHTREDRDSVVEILFDNIEFPNGWGNNFGQSISTSTDFEEYDLESIMHYGPTAFGKKVPTNDVTTTLQTIRLRADPKADPSTLTFGNKKELSAGDIAAINFMYPTQHDCGSVNKDLPDGIYVVRATKLDGQPANRYLDLDASTDGDVLRLNSIFGETTIGTGQRWKVDKIPNADLGGYTINNEKWLTYIDADSSNTGNGGCKVQGWQRGNTLFGRTNQEWYITVVDKPASNQFRCRVFNVKSPEMVLDAKDDGSEDSPVVLFHNNVSDHSQEFLFQTDLVSSDLHVVPTTPDISPSSAHEYPSPMYFTVSLGAGWNASDVQNIKTWLTLDGSAPTEDPSSARLVDDGGLSGMPGKPIQITGSGAKSIHAKTFCSALDERIAGDTVLQLYQLYQPIAGPTGLIASHDKPNEIALTWNPIAGATYDLFTLYSNDDPLDLSHSGQIQVNGQPIQGTTYTDNTYPGSGASFTYYVRARLPNINRITRASGPVVGSYAIPAMSFLASLQGHTVRLTWSYPSWGVPGDYDMTYSIYRSAGQDYRQANLLATNQRRGRPILIRGHLTSVPLGAETSYADNSVQAGQTYYYWVIASTVHDNVQKSSPYGSGVRVTVE